MVRDESVEIALTNTDDVALVSKEDYNRLKDIPWYKSAYGYAIKNFYRGDNKWEVVRMHREVIGAKDGQHVDHINGDKLDNRRSNLRIATPLQNNWNKGLTARNSSGYKGVSERNGRYESYIRNRGILEHLGTYESKEDAAKAYNVKAEEYFGEFAWLNDVDHKGFKIRDKHVPYSKFRGTWYHKDKNKWYAGITHKGKQMHLGSFESEIDAAKAYNKAAIEYHKERAVLNDV